MWGAGIKDAMHHYNSLLSLSYIYLTPLATLMKTLTVIEYKWHAGVNVNV